VKATRQRRPRPRPGGGAGVAQASSGVEHVLGCPGTPVTAPSACAGADWAGRRSSRDPSATPTAAAAANERAGGGHDCGSLLASSASARSATHRAMGPLSRCTPLSPAAAAAGPARRSGTTPGEGRMPTTPQKEAGMRSEPPRSEPVASQACRRAGRHSVRCKNGQGGVMLVGGSACDRR